MAPPRSSTRLCAFCGGRVPPTAGAGGPCPEGTFVHDDTPTDPVPRVTVTRRRVTPPRPRVDPAYREWLDTPLEHTEPPKITGPIVLVVVVLLVCVVILTAEVIT